MCHKKLTIMATKKINAQKMHEEEVVASVVLKTRKALNDLEQVDGTLYRKGQYDLVFTEQKLQPRKTRAWECRVTLASEKPYARISANANGGFLSVYVPRQNFVSTRELVEILLDQTERLCEKMEGVDALAIIDKLDALKHELIAA